MAPASEMLKPGHAADKDPFALVVPEGYKKAEEFVP